MSATFPDRYETIFGVCLKFSSGGANAELYRNCLFPRFLSQTQSKSSHVIRLFQMTVAPMKTFLENHENFDMTSLSRPERAWRPHGFPWIDEATAWKTARHAKILKH